MNAVGHQIEMWPLLAWTKKMSRTIGCIVRKVNYMKLPTMHA